MPFPPCTGLFSTSLPQISLLWGLSSFSVLKEQDLILLILPILSPSTLLICAFVIIFIEFIPFGYNFLI